MVSKARRICTFEVLWFSSSKFNEKNLARRRKMKIVADEGKKKAKFWAVRGTGVQDTEVACSLMVLVLFRPSNSIRNERLEVEISQKLDLESCFQVHESDT